MNNMNNSNISKKSDQSTAKPSLDYSKLGLKCGIEIHQRLDTHKLFCKCPSVLRDDAPDIIVKRKLRAVAGELGEIDVAAQHELEKDIYFIYEGYSDTTCLVELDEEPPHLMNKDALNTVLQIALMLNATVVDEVQIMRKTVVNGSNTTGFQRTALVAVKGRLDTDLGPVGIPTISVEEEAAKDVTKGVDELGKRFVVYRLDRLGIPLVEIATDPDIHSPEQCRDVAARLGMILRSTGKVARGLGTIRQDVNVSIAKGARIEVKGAQDLKMIPTLVEFEVLRQINLLDIKEKLGKISIADEIFNLSDLFRNCESKVVKSALANGGVWGIKLDKFAGLIGKDIQPGRRLGTEFSDYAKVKAGVGGIFHSDELPKYGITNVEVELVRKKLKCSKDDAFVLVADTEQKSLLALKEVIYRAKLCEKGVLKEVRKPNDDGTTSFMRPIPGSARLYPETDTLPIKTDTSGIVLPELLEEKSTRYKDDLQLGKDLANDLSKSGKHDLFESFVSEFKNIKPAFIAETLISTPKNLKRKFGVDESKIKETDFRNVFNHLDKGLIAKDSVEAILLKIAKSEKFSFSDFKPLSDSDLEKEVKRILNECKELEFRLVIPKIMETLRGRAEGKKIMDLLNKLKK